MTTKKKSKAARLGALALALTLVTTCLMGGTMARYVTEVTGSATATVAAWSFKANEGKETFTNIDLGLTENRDVYLAEDIKEGVIAPGTAGSFDIVIDGTDSEVGVDYIVKLAAAKDTKLPGDLTFEIDETAYTLGTELLGTIDYGANMTKTLKVTWNWEFDKDNTKTDNDNDYAGKKWILDITVTGKQTEPTTPSN